MSIDEVLQSAVDAKLLWYLPMAMDSDPQPRTLLLEKDVLDLIAGPYANALHENRANILRADLESFVAGRAISICLRPRKAKDADLGLLEPEGDAVWDFRSRKTPPGLRLIGCFAKMDTFVAMDWWPRSVKVSWSNKEPLEDDEIKWRCAKHECLERWHRILAGLVPVAGQRVESYVSENFLSV